MAGASKNSRTAVATQKFSCPCGGEVVLKTMVENGKIKISLNAQNVIVLNADLKILNNLTKYTDLKAATLVSGSSFLFIFLY